MNQFNYTIEEKKEMEKKRDEQKPRPDSFIKPEESTTSTTTLKPE